METDKERNAVRLHEVANIIVVAQFLHSNELQEFNDTLYVPSSLLLSIGAPSPTHSFYHPPLSPPRILFIYNRQTNRENKSCQSYERGTFLFLRSRGTAMAKHEHRQVLY